MEEAVWTRIFLAEILICLAAENSLTLQQLL
jgi:hypothetical protein